MDIFLVKKMVLVSMHRSIVEKDRPVAVVGMKMSSMAATVLRFDLVIKASDIS